MIKNEDSQRTEIEAVFFFMESEILYEMNRIVDIQTLNKISDVHIQHIN